MIRKAAFQDRFPQRPSAGAWAASPQLQHDAAAYRHRSWALPCSSLPTAPEWTHSPLHIHTSAQCNLLMISGLIFRQRHDLLVMSWFAPSCKETFQWPKTMRLEFCWCSSPTAGPSRRARYFAAVPAARVPTGAEREAGLEPAPVLHIWTPAICDSTKQLRQPPQRPLQRGLMPWKFTLKQLQKLQFPLLIWLLSSESTYLFAFYFCLYPFIVSLSTSKGMLPKPRPGDCSFHPLPPYQHEFISIKASFLNQDFSF